VEAPRAFFVEQGVCERQLPAARVASRDVAERWVTALLRGSEPPAPLPGQRHPPPCATPPLRPGVPISSEGDNDKERTKSIKSMQEHPVNTCVHMMLNTNLFLTHAYTSCRKELKKSIQPF